MGAAIVALATRPAKRVPTGRSKNKLIVSGAPMWTVSLCVVVCTKQKP